MRESERQDTELIGKGMGGREDNWKGVHGIGREMERKEMACNNKRCKLCCIYVNVAHSRNLLCVHLNGSRFLHIIFQPTLQNVLQPHSSFGCHGNIHNML